jgi:16S rRNA (adenine1518-N6/adenine1519-N6)-dimethyltransferase
MTKRELLCVLARLGKQPDRRRGQNFLVDRNLLAAMVSTTALQAGEQVLEIGPGAGILTREILAAGCQVTAVELDAALAGYLRAELGHFAGFRLVEGDACVIDYDSLYAGHSYRCLANLPYSITGPLLGRFARLTNPPQELFLLLQKEVASRLAADHGSREYGALTVRVRLAYSVEVLRRVPATVFFPQPKVDSAYVHLRLLSQRPAPALGLRLDETLAAAFSQRRKMLPKVLATRFGMEAIVCALARAGVPVTARAEDLSPQNYVALAQALCSGTAVQPGD